MDDPKKSLNDQLLELKSIKGLNRLINEKQELIDIKEREIGLRKDLVFARIESHYGFSEKGFDVGLFTRGIISDVFKTRPEIDSTTLMKVVKSATKFVPYFVSAFRR